MRTRGLRGARSPVGGAAPTVGKAEGAVSRKPLRPAFSAAHVSRTAQLGDWLNALDGVAYLAAPDGRIVGVGQEGWARFTREVGGLSPAPQSVVGRSLFEMIAGDEARVAFLAVHGRVASLARRALTYEYRCDAPDLERLMKMSVSALTTRGRLLGVLYQSTLLSTKERVPLEFLSDSEATREERRLSGLPFVKICQFCADVTMKAWGEEWVKPIDYYRRGGETEVRLSHGVCPECERTRLEPLVCG